MSETLESRISDLLAAYRDGDGAHCDTDKYDRKFAKLTQNIAYLIREREANANPQNVSIVSATTRINSQHGLVEKCVLAVLYRGLQKMHKIAVVVDGDHDNDWILSLIHVVDDKVRMALESML